MRNYTWVGNKITAEQMAQLYKLKEVAKRSITEMVKEAVGLYLIEKDYLFWERAEESTDMIPSSL